MARHSPSIRLQKASGMMVQIVRGKDDVQTREKMAAE